MDYATHRSGIKSGDLLAWSHRGWRTIHDIKIQMVRMFTQSEYSHVGIAWVVGGRVFVIEAVVPVVRIYPLSKLGSFYHIPTNAQWTPEVEEIALNSVGVEYSQLEAIRAFFEPLEKGNVSECAALAIQVLSNAGLDVGRRATPDAVVLMVQKMGGPTYFVEQK